MLSIERILKSLHEAEAEFIVIGGVAAILHGSAHITLDMDICYRRTRQNYKRIAEALAPFHPRLRGKDVPPRLSFVLDAQTLEMGLNFTLTTDVGDVDLLGEISGVGGYNDILKEAERFTAYGIEFDVIGLTALIRNKRATLRVKDQRILPELEALLEIKEKQSKK